MDPKNPKRGQDTDDLRGFEEFIEHATNSQPASEKNAGKNVGGENLTFLTHDYERLKRIAELLSHKLTVARKHEQGEKLLENLTAQNARLKTELVALLQGSDSPLGKSMAEIFDGYFRKGSAS